MEFLQNVHVIKRTKHQKILIQNNEIFDLFLKKHSYRGLFTKAITKLPHKSYLFRKKALLTNFSLIKLYIPDFIINFKNFQLPCSIKSSILRAIKIVSGGIHPSPGTVIDRE